MADADGDENHVASFDGEEVRRVASTSKAGFDRAISENTEAEEVSEKTFVDDGTNVVEIDTWAIERADTNEDDAIAAEFACMSVNVPGVVPKPPRKTDESAFNSKPLRKTEESGGGRSHDVKIDQMEKYTCAAVQSSSLSPFGKMTFNLEGARSKLVIVSVEGKKDPKWIAKKSCFCLNTGNVVRQIALVIVESKWCDRIILAAIGLNSLMLMLEQRRAPDDEPINRAVNIINNWILSTVFLFECIFKIISWGFRFYLSDSWNVLDFIVVVTAVIDRLPFFQVSGLGFLRLFRLLRPLRSLNSMPEMKVLVNTCIGAVPRLSNVFALGVFLFLMFAIAGVTLMQGIFYTECRLAENPSLIETDGRMCWNWPKLGNGRLCGGYYDCTRVEDDVVIRDGYCGGHEFDLNGYEPVFKSPLDSLGPARGGPYGWCEDSAPVKVAPELDFVHFDHIAGAFLLIFQCMTMEGWTDIMYYVKDAYHFVPAVIYFFLMIIVTSHFLLNVALAVVDEVRDDFENEEDDEKEEEDESEEISEADDSDEPELWMDCQIVQFCSMLTRSPSWQNFIMFIIMANVVTMCVQKFPPDVVVDETVRKINSGILIVFTIEMVVELIARGVTAYIKYPVTCFDGFTVCISLLELVIRSVAGDVAGGGSGSQVFQALRTLRLFRVLNKVGSRSPSVKVLLKAMVGTAQALKAWLLLFVLVLYIFTLLLMYIFANQLHFEDADDAANWDGRRDGKPWCVQELDTPLARRRTTWQHKQDCIPRAHYDNFGWGFVTVFQIMTGENWNAIMYAGMRAGRSSNIEWLYGLLYVVLLLSGQILFLSLFLSMLLSKFDQFRQELVDDLQKQAMRKRGLTFKDDIDVVVDKGPGETFRNAWHSLKTMTTHFKPNLHSEDAVASQEKWPHGYSWFFMEKEFPLRLLAQDILSKNVSVNGHQINVFDTFILICILLSTVCMMIDYPIADPHHPIIIVVRMLENVFVIVFIVEMCIKLMAWPVFWGEGAYFTGKGSGWNWLDATVVAVSVLDVMKLGLNGMKNMRILRALRPLKAIKRHEKLRNIVECIFNSMKELGVLLVVFILFLLIFALVFMMFLNGQLNACTDNDVWFHRDLGDGDFMEFTMPLCLSLGTLATAQFRGDWNENTSRWDTSTSVCGEGKHANATISWQRATPDTPVCVARCDPFFREPFNSTYSAPAEYCPRKYEKTEELPHRCSDDVGSRPNRNKYDEEVGFLFVEKMQASYTIPCGGSTASSVDNIDTDERSGLGWGNGLTNGSLNTSWADVMGTPANRSSCRQLFCPIVQPGLVEKCANEVELHPHFCSKTCAKDVTSAKCRSCRHEYKAACECPDFCTPLMLDAALCAEQGGGWEPVLSQDFDNVWHSMLTLIEISTTEGWVDTMYAACDTTELGGIPYIQPLRDGLHPVWMALFVAWILLSFMFLVNLAVGIIVDKFMEMRSEGKDVISATQLRWIKSRMNLITQSNIFNLTDLHLLPSWRRLLYEVIEHRYFERAILSCILLNTVLMSGKVFPQLETPETEGFRSFSKVLNNVFVIVFTVEALVKLIVLRKRYFRDMWNLFDFVCVASTLAGKITEVVYPRLNVSSVASVARIFRIARVLRILKTKAFARLNTLFKSMAVSTVKLVNVAFVAFLFLVLFSIFGVNMFGKISQESDTVDVHGNFMHFPNAFITLFRASTGEAWNEIMHDLNKNELDWFKASSWCTPEDLYDPEEKYSVLQDKCLIERPNACVMTIWGFSPFPWTYWLAYTMVMALVIMNVVIAVILEGYEETKSSDEGAIIETCKSLWGSKYDPDHKGVLMFPMACRFVVEAVQELQKDQCIEGEPVDIKLPADTTDSVVGLDLSRFPLKYARVLDIRPTTFVTFEEATKQVCRFAAAVENPRLDVVSELAKCDTGAVLKTKEMQTLTSFESKRAVQREVQQDRSHPLFHHIAAMQMQRMIRVALERFRRRRLKNRGVMIEDSDAAATRRKEIDHHMRCYVKYAARATNLAVRTGISPPIPG